MFFKSPCPYSHPCVLHNDVAIRVTIKTHVYLTFRHPEDIRGMTSCRMRLQDHDIGHKLAIEALVLNLSACFVGPSTSIVGLISGYDGHYLVSGQLSVLQACNTPSSDIRLKYNIRKILKQSR